MNYQKIYVQLIETRRLRDISKDYERHHIIPFSISHNNNKNNIIKLTYKEHYFAHLLLRKIYQNVSKEINRI